jgi:hypothetical protein
MAKISSRGEIARFANVIPQRGSYRCYRCAAAVEMPGTCRACGEAMWIDEVDAMFAPALESIPESFRWATADAAIDDHCRASIGGAPVRIGQIARMLAASLRSRDARTILIRGTVSGSGKTVLACAVVRAVIDSARIEALTQPQGHPTRRGPDGGALGGERWTVTLGRGAVFVREADLASLRDRSALVAPPEYERAKHVPLLLLDAVGDASGARQDAAASAALRVETLKVLDDRWNHGKPTIVTTYLSEDQIGDLYAGGTFRRLCTDAGARVIECGR